MKKGWGFAVAAGALVAAGLSGTAWASGGAQSRDLTIVDRCDPASFNAAVGPGACEYAPGSNQRGTITFAEFAASLNPTAFGDDHWRFNPSERSAKVGERLTFNVHNEGGEFHTFTRVAKFGGGCVDQLNGPLELTLAPECDGVHFDPTAPPPPAFITTGVPSGMNHTVDVDTSKAGTVKYQCLIHPWMRTAVTVG